jgi:prepilin-type N-terminal cleavage/methylation domain-containing protein
MKKGFTLPELVIVLVIVGLIITFLIPAYYNLLERSKAMACESNQRVLLGALELYGSDHNLLPASLSQLRQKDLDKAWANLWQQKGSWKIKLAYFILDLNERGVAQAAESWLQDYLNLVKSPACPSDTTPPPQGYSYGINSSLAGKSFAIYDEAPSEALVIADCEHPTFDETLAPRHIKYSLFGGEKYAIGITKGHQIVYELSSGTPGEPIDEDDEEEEGEGCKCWQHGHLKQQCKQGKLPNSCPPQENFNGPPSGDYCACYPADMQEYCKVGMLKKCHHQ